MQVLEVARRGIMSKRRDVMDHRNAGRCWEEAGNMTTSWEKGEERTSHVIENAHGRHQHANSYQSVWT